jgi:hypothetical protein
MLFAKTPYDSDKVDLLGAGLMHVPECSDREMEWTCLAEGSGAGESQRGMFLMRTCAVSGSGGSVDVCGG